jgi:hypothetical protein
MPRKQPQSSEFNAQVDKAASQVATAIVHNFPKPIYVNTTELELGDLEFIENLVEDEAAGKRMSVKQIYELFAHFCKNWTVEDVRKLKIKDLPAARDAIFAAIREGSAVPNDSATNS